MNAAILSRNSAFRLGTGNLGAERSSSTTRCPRPLSSVASTMQCNEVRSGYTLGLLLLRRGGSDMRIVNILSGLAVLFTTLAFAHLLHHYFLNAGEAAHSPPFLAGMIIGGVVGIFSFIGGCLLLRRGR
jgi:hypothetical protein